MGKRADIGGQLRIALEILQRIPPHTKISAEELQLQLADAGLQRDLRTIQRQLKLLTDEFDIERDTSDRPYGYKWKSNARPLALPTIGPRESLLLTLAAEQLRPMLPASIFRSLDPFFRQASRNLEPTRNARLEREWLKKVRVVNVTQPLLPPRIKPGVFEAVSNALYGNFWLVVEYQNAAGETHKSDVMPLGLAQQGQRLYLVCRYQGYENERTLAVHRIQSARMTTLSFERPRNFDLASYEADGRFNFGNGRRVSLHFMIRRKAGQHLLETPLSTDQEVAIRDDALAISATVVETQLLEQWLLGFGEDVWDVRKVPLPTP